MCGGGHDVRCLSEKVGTVRKTQSPMLFRRVRCMVEEAFGEGELEEPTWEIGRVVCRNEDVWMQRRRSKASGAGQE